MRLFASTGDDWVADLRLRYPDGRITNRRIACNEQRSEEQALAAMTRRVCSVRERMAGTAPEIIGCVMKRRWQWEAAKCLV